MPVRADTSQLVSELPDDAVITAIRPVARDPALRQIRVDDQTIATIRDTDVQALGLNVGTPLDPELRRSIIGIVTVNKARKTAMSLLGRRAYSAATLTDRLQRRGHDAAAAATVVGELVDDGWVDDQQFARAVVDEILAREPAGQPKLMQALASRGLPEEVARSVVDDVLDSTDQRGDALEFARTRLGRMSSQRGPTAARRIAGMLARRGIDQDTVSDVIRELGILDDTDADVQ